MEIYKIIEQKNSFIVNDELNVPKSEGNSDYRKVRSYIEAGGKYQAYNQLLEKKTEKIAQCQDYLEQTDWQANAFIKYGRPIDANVPGNCLKAKQWKSDIKACTTIEELENININFN